MQGRGNLVLITILSISVASRATAIADGITIIAQSGDQAADASILATFGLDPVIDSSGQVAFTSWYDGGGGGIFVSAGAPDNAENFSTLGSIGDSAEDGTGDPASFTGFFDPRVNDSGQVLFSGSTTGDTTNAGIYIGSAGYSPSLVVGNGQAQYQDNTVTFPNPALNGAGQVAYTDGTNLYEGTQELMGTNQEVPLYPGDSLVFFYSSNPIEHFALNDAGQVAVSASTAQSTNQSGAYEGIFLYNSSGQGTLIARNTDLGTPADGPVGSVTFNGFQGGALSLNASGQVAFGASLSDNTNGIYIGMADNSGNVTDTEVARGGITYADSNGGSVGLDSYGSPAMNNSAQVAFKGYSDSSQSVIAGIYRGDGSVDGFGNHILTTIASVGQAAPEINNGSGAYGGTFSDFTNPSIISSGAVAFNAIIGGANDFNGNPLTSSTGIFIGDGIDLLAAARVGDSLDGSTIVSLSDALGEDNGGKAAVNDYGQITYQATLASGASGIFLWTPALNYRSTVSGNWDTSSNWTLGIAPAVVHDVSIAPTTLDTNTGNPIVVTGPAAPVTINSLTLGSGATPVELDLQPGGPITLDAAFNYVNYGAVLGGQGVINGNILMTGGGSVTASGTFEGLFADYSGSIIQPSGDLSFEDPAGGGFGFGGPGLPDFYGFYSGGTLTVGAHTVNLLEGTPFTAVSALSGLDGNTTLAGGSIVATGTMLNSTYGYGTTGSPSYAVLSGYGNVQSDLFINGTSGTVRAKGGGLLLNGSTSLAAKVVNFGLLEGDAGSAGTAAGGRITVDGNFTQAASGTLALQIGGLVPSDGSTAANDYTFLDVTGSATFGGILDVTLANNFDPQLGDAFSLLDWGTFGGSDFSTVDLPALGPGLSWNTSSLYITGQVSVTGVPEPGAWTLLAGGLSVLTISCRKRVGSRL